MIKLAQYDNEIAGCFQVMKQLRTELAEPCSLINVNGYFDLLLSFLDNSVSNGFMKKEHRDMLLVSNTPEDLLVQMDAYRAPQVEKWLDVKTRI